MRILTAFCCTVTTYGLNNLREIKLVLNLYTNFCYAANRNEVIVIMCETLGDENAIKATNATSSTTQVISTNVFKMTPIVNHHMQSTGFMHQSFRTIKLVNLYQ